MQKNMETGLSKFLRKTIEYLGYLFVFILPWQIKLILRPAETNYSEISLYISHILLLLILGLFLFFRLKETECKYNCRSIVYSLTALEIFVLVSVFFAPDKILAFYHYFIFLLAFSLFFIVRLGTEPQNYQETLFDKVKLIYVFLGSILFQASLGIYQFLTQSSFASKYLGLAIHNPDTLGTAVIETVDGRWLRAYGGMDHPNILGGVLAISLILAAYLLAKQKLLVTKKQVAGSVFLFVFYFIALYALFFTFSRTAWLAYALGLLTLLITFIINKDKWIIGRFVALLFFSALLLMIAAAPFQDLLLVRLDAKGRLEQKSLNERAAYITESESLIHQNFLTGVGIGNYSVVTSQKDNYQKSAWDYQPVHNSFLLLCVENGVFSFISFLVFLFFLVKNGRRETYSVALFISFLVLMFLDHWLISLPFGLIFLFLFLGLI